MEILHGLGIQLKYFISIKCFVYIVGPKDLWYKTVLIVFLILWCKFFDKNTNKRTCRWWR